MRIDGLKARGFGPFAAEIDIDIAGLPGLLVAIVGENGAGKSTFVELFPGALHRATPTRGKLTELASARDAFLEARVTNGASYTLRHTVDSVSKKSEALILDALGAPVLSTTSVKAYDAWAATHFPEPAVLLSSIFAAQKPGTFCDLGASDRKAVLCRLLGIEALEGMAKRAGERAAAIRVELAGVEGERRSLPTLDVVDLRAQLPIAQEAAGAADAALAAGRRDADAAIAYRRVSAALIADRAKLVDLEERIGNNRKLLADADGIRAAAARCRAIREEVIALTSQEQGAASAMRAIEQRRQEAATRAAQARDAIQLADRRADAARARAARRAEVEAAEAALPAARAAVAGADEVIAKLRLDEREVQDGALGGAEIRVKGLRGGLSRISLPSTNAGAADPRTIARATLEADTSIADAQKSAPKRLQEIRAEIGAELQALDAARAKVVSLEVVAGLRATVDAADSDLARAVEDRDRARVAEQEASAAALEIGAELEASRRAGSERAGKITALKDEEKALEARARFLEKVDAAAEVLEIRERDAADVRAQIASLSAELATLPPPAEIDLVGLEEAAWRAHAAVTRLTAEIERAEASSSRRAELDVAIAALHEELADWDLLAEDLGPRGLPALLIDAAGPELTELVNDLLHTCVGSRFTASIETTRATADGKKLVETCEVRVLDTVKGRDAPVETYSGGERVLVAEAVSLALSVLACRRSGAAEVTLVRDESGAALSPGNARAYVAMIRRAAEVVHASKVLLISHDPDVQALCDSRLVVANGTVTVEAA